MTDKQIIIDGIKTSKEDFIDNFAIELTNRNIFERKQIGDKYFEIILAKEQECEELKIYIESNEQQVKEVETLVMDNDRLINELDQLKAENKHLNDLLNQALKDYDKTRETLTEIKPILEYYANSTIGEEQEDGTYRIELSYKYGSSNMYGTPCYYKYNPQPAKQALQKISESEGNDD